MKRLLKRLRIIFSALGWIIAIGLTIWFGLPRQPRLAFELINHTNVVDIKDKTTKLDIRYNDKSISSTGNTLKVATIRLINDGTGSIHKDDFADSSFGFTITNGDIIEPPQILSASSDYLTKNIKPILDGTNKVMLSPVILNPNDFVTIKILVLYHGNPDDIIQACPIGTIAGINKILVRQLLDTDTIEAFWSQLFLGNVWIQLARIGAYGSVLFSIGYICGLIIEFYIDTADKRGIRRREKIVEAYKKETTYIACDISKIILRNYISDFREIYALYRMMRDNEDATKKILDDFMTFVNKSIR